MPTRSHLTRPRPRQALIDLGDGDQIRLTYDANKLTTSWLQEGLIRDGENDPMSLAKALSDVILGWDVVEDDGGPFPATAENIAVFSIPVQRALISQLMGAALPQSAEGEVSSSSSSTQNAASSNGQGDHQNGLAISPSLTPSESPSTS